MIQSFFLFVNLKVYYIGVSNAIFSDGIAYVPLPSDFSKSDKYVCILALCFVSAYAIFGYGITDIPNNRIRLTAYKGGNISFTGSSYWNAVVVYK